MAVALVRLPYPRPSPWELAAEAIAVKIRWFGLLVGYVLVNLGWAESRHKLVLNGILGIGLAYTLLDTYFSMRGRIVLRRWPLVVSVLEGLFISLLCYYDRGVESPFRYYYFLSLICCAVRHPSRITYLTCALHCLGYSLLYLALPAGSQQPGPFIMTLVMLGWVTWASTALALLLKHIGEYLGQVNSALQENQAELERRIEERTRALQEAQAHVLHQEKMAAFGLLAAGIAHEVGNPLTSISSLVQILQRRDSDSDTLRKLTLINGQLQRIRTTLRELVEFSRPASSERTRASLAEVLEEALNIAKYYKRTRGRIGSPLLPADLPPLHVVRDQIVQVFLNLILNAIDATERQGRIELAVQRLGPMVEVSVHDSGSGIHPADVGRLFQPYFTTKKHGTGLGLFVTRQMVAEQGGTVSFESQPGVGTTFRVCLPLAPVAGDKESSPGPVLIAEGESGSW